MAEQLLAQSLDPTLPNGACRPMNVTNQPSRDHHREPEGLDKSILTGQSARVATLEDLWGSTVRSMGFDPTARVLFLVARVTDDGATTAFTLRLFGVSELRIDLPAGEPWDYTEITEVHAAATPTGFVVNLMFWDESSGLTARCTDYLVEA